MVLRQILDQLQQLNNPFEKAFEMPENQEEFLSKIKEKEIFKLENCADVYKLGDLSKPLGKGSYATVHRVVLVRRAAIRHEEDPIRSVEVFRKGKG